MGIRKKIVGGGGGGGGGGKEKEKKKRSRRNEEEVYERRPRQFDGDVEQAGGRRAVDDDDKVNNDDDGRGKRRTKEETYVDAAGLPLKLPGRKIALKRRRHELRRDEKDENRTVEKNELRGKEERVSTDNIEKQKDKVNNGDLQDTGVQYSLTNETEWRKEIARLSMAILSNPEKHIRKELAALIDMAEHEVYMTTDKSIMARAKSEGQSSKRRSCASLPSLSVIFQDICPGYRIRIPTEAELKVVVSKEVKVVRDYEQLLLKMYRKYLLILHNCCKGRVATKSNGAWKRKKMEMKNDPTDSRRHGNGTDSSATDCTVGGVENGTTHGDEMSSRAALRLVALRCACNLIPGLAHFNYANEIIHMLVPFLNSSIEQERSIVRSSMAPLLSSRSESHLASILAVVNGISTMIIKENNYSLRSDDAVALLAKVSIDAGLSEVFDKEVKEAKAGKAGNWKERRDRNGKFIGRKAIIKEKKVEKKERMAQFLKEVESDFRESSMSSSRLNRAKIQSTILETIFAVYFSILKDAEWRLKDNTKSTIEPCPLLAAALDGIGTHIAHLDVEYISSLSTLLQQLAAADNLGIHVRLRAADAAASMRRGSALILDMSKLYVNVALCLEKAVNGFLIPTTLDEKFDATLLRALSSLLLSCAPEERNEIASFLKRMCVASLQLSTAGTLGSLALISKLLHRHPRSRFILEGRGDSESFGAGTVMPDMQNNFHSQITPLWELSLLGNHFNPDVPKVSRSLAEMDMSQDVLRISELADKFGFASMNVEDIIKLYDAGKGAFNPQPMSHPMRKTTNKVDFKSNGKLH